LKINYSISKLSLKKFTILLLLAASTVGAFATLGTPGRGKKEKAGKSLLSNKTSTYTGTFSLQSGYTFRGSRVINTQENKYINLNTVVTYQQGHTTYVVPLKKKIVLNGKITFNPNAATR